MVTPFGATDFAATNTATAFVSVLNGLLMLPLPVVSLPLVALTKIDVSGASVGVIGPGWPQRVQAVPPTIPARALAATAVRKSRENQTRYIAGPLCRAAPQNL